ncbi:GNAT family N-acetyltransferase [Salinibius halmophilus]|uniref:GNAT family N-acetyltransferase n=1 Tax=Salinibius halmophilus TaxID=1853216 RepID=UPI000E66F322|nr:GNAT family N-acetyltransferase [Salinibius halmophilus]
MTLPFTKDYGLGLFTDLRINADNLEVNKLDAATLIRSLDAPLYFYGNMIWLDQPPVSSHIELAEQIFSHYLPNAVHRTLAWHGKVVKDQSAFEQAGYQLHQTTTLSRNDTPSLSNIAYTFRPITTSDDWSQWLQLELAEYNKSYGDSYLEYSQTRRDRYQALASFGEYLGAFDGDKLVGALGLYCFDGIARFQSVLTHAEYRGRGIASALLRQALNRAQYEQAVIVAESGSAAEKLYKKNGFTPVEQESAWMKY